VILGKVPFLFGSVVPCFGRVLSKIVDTKNFTLDKKVYICYSTLYHLKIKEGESVKIKKIVSGGQTGADQAGLDAAIACGVEYGGYIPKGRRTEKGPLSYDYQMIEHTSKEYPPRTKFNIMISHGTVVFTYGTPNGGSALTFKLAIGMDKPIFHANLLSYTDEEIVKSLGKWCNKLEIRVLNVAGSRASKYPEIYDRVFNIISSILNKNV
jgi:hypothetical protein